MSAIVSVCPRVSSGFNVFRLMRAVLIVGVSLMTLPAIALDGSGVDTSGAGASGVDTSGVDTSGVATQEVAAPDIAAAPVAAASNATPGIAASGAGPHTMPAPGSAVATTSPLNMMLGLLFLLGLVALAWWFVKRTGGAQWQGARAMKVVASLPVGARERVMLIEVGGQQVLVGVAPGRVNLLHRFEEPVVIDTAGGEDFASKIRQVMQHGLHR